MHPDFLAHLAAVERAIHLQLLQLDPQYAHWAMGISWRIEVPLGAVIGELPARSFWQPNAPSLSAAVAPPRERVAQAMRARDSAFTKTTFDAPEFSPTQPMTAR